MNLASLPPHARFLDTIAADWLARAGDDPLAVANGLILLPTPPRRPRPGRVVPGTDRRAAAAAAARHRVRGAGRSAAGPGRRVRPAARRSPLPCAWRN